MSECIFGIKCNGVSISVSQISIDNDQSMYDYICNVSLKSDFNGNGTYDVSIINKDFIQGMPVGKWRINKAWIRYNCGEAMANLIMEDEDGNKTNEIIAGSQKGSVSGFHVPTLAKTIFTKAQEIVRDYPNAKICNSIMELNKSIKSLNVSYLKGIYGKVVNEPDEEFISSISYVINKISKHLEVFKNTKEILEKYDDQRSVNLLKNITSDCRHLLDGFKYHHGLVHLENL